MQLSESGSAFGWAVSLSAGDGWTAAVPEAHAEPVVVQYGGAPVLAPEKLLLAAVWCEAVLFAAHAEPAVRYAGAPALAAEKLLLAAVWCEAVPLAAHAGPAVRYAGAVSAAQFDQPGVWPAQVFDTARALRLPDAHRRVKAWGLIHQASGTQEIQDARAFRAVHYSEHPVFDAPRA